MEVKKERDLTIEDLKDKAIDCGGVKFTNESVPMFEYNDVLKFIEKWTVQQKREARKEANRHFHEYMVYRAEEIKRRLAPENTKNRFIDWQGVLMDEYEKIINKLNFLKGDK